MDITSKASITVTAKLSAAELYAAVYAVPGAVDAVLNGVQAEAVKDATSLTFISRDVAANADGTVSAELVYEKVVGQAPAASEDAAASTAPADAAGEAAPVAPVVGLTPAAATA